MKVPLSAFTYIGFAGAVLIIGLLAGCETYVRAKTAEKAVLEPIVDAAYDSAVMRVCNLPMDIQMRAVQRHGTQMITGMVAMCPSWRFMRDSMLSAALTGMGYDLTPGVSKPIPIPASIESGIIEPPIRCDNSSSLAVWEHCRQHRKNAGKL